MTAAAEGPHRLAVVQPQGFPFNTAGALDEVERWSREAARKGAGLVLFPEAFLGGYPWGLRFGTVVGGRTEAGRRLFQRYRDAAITVPGPETQRMGELAAELAITLAVGVVERDPYPGAATLYCTLLLLGSDGSILGKHRKVKPTAAERLVWGEGDGSTLPVVDTPLGRMGGLICWENYMPMARMALYGKGVEIYLAPTADARDRWQATLTHIALEGRCFVLGCNQIVHRGDFPDDEDMAAELIEAPEVLCRGGSAVYGPDGACLAGPLYDETGLLLVDMDPGAIHRGKLDFDVVGHYARSDLFRLEVDETPQPPVRYKGIPEAPAHD